MTERLAARRLIALLLAAGLAASAVSACSSGSTGASPTPTPTPYSPPPVFSPTPPAMVAEPESPACYVASTGPAYRLERCYLQSPSLAGNLLGDSVLHFFVLTPRDYATSGLRYPSVYFLTGYTDDASESAEMVARSAISAKTPAGKVPPIVVTVAGLNVFGGSMYANSAIGGNWEDAVTHDLIGYVDSYYRTIGTRESRGITGHSMGGAGAINIAMHHAELFGALYAMSPAVFDASEGSWMMDPSIAGKVLGLEDQIKAAGKLSAAERANRIEAAVAADPNLRFPFAYGTAFNGDLASPILMDFPYKGANGQADPTLLARWQSGWGRLAERVAQYEAALQKYAAIGVDCGTLDGVWSGSHRFVGLLQGAGIAVEENAFNGGHTDQFDDRMLNHTLPFMAEHLAQQ